MQGTTKAIMIEKVATYVAVMLQHTKYVCKDLPGRDGHKWEDFGMLEGELLPLVD